MTKTLEQALEIYESIASNSDLKVRAQGVFEALQGLSGEENIAKIATAEDEYLRNRYSVNSLGTVMSRANYYKLIERQLKLAEGDNAQQVVREKGGKPHIVLRHWFFKYCGLSKSEFYPASEVPSEWGERNASSEVFERSQVEVEVHPQELIEKAYELLQSSNPWEVGAGLVAVTGRRPYEIVFRGKFTKIEGDEYRVQFKGQSKKRGEEPVFPISVLVPSDVFLKAFNKFRSNPDVKAVLASAKAEAQNDPSQLHRKIDSRSNKKLNRVIKRDFKEILPPRLDDEQFKASEENEADINCTALKAAYLVMATKRDLGEASLLRQLVYASTLAGHFINPEDKDALKRADSELKRHIPATLHYTSYCIKGEVPYFEPVKPSVPSSRLPSCRLHQEDKAQLDEWAKLWGMSNQAEAMSKVFELARQALAMPTPQPTETKEEKMDNTAVEQLEQKLENYQRQTEQKIDQLLQLLQKQQQQAPAIASDQPQTEQPKPEEKQQPKQPSRDWESVPKSELFGEGDSKPAKGTGATEERIRRAVQAIMDWNNQFPHNQNPERKWSINNRAIRDLASVNGMAVKEWLESHEQLVNDHNLKHGIDDIYHNRCHKAVNKSSADLIREEVYPLIQ
jgi:hypothetical protein